MKTKFLIALLFLLNFSINSQIITKPMPPTTKPAPCPLNANAENGDFTNWVTYTNQATDPLIMNNFVQNFDPLRAGVHMNTGNSSNFQFGPYLPMITNGVDNYGNFAIPNEGTHCFRLGNNGIGADGAQADLMRFTFTVTDNNKIFRYRYAVVLEDPNDGTHTAGQKPSFAAYITKGAKISPVFNFNNLSDVVLYNNTKISATADVNDAFFKISPINNNVVYKDWQCVEYDLSAYVGQQVSFCVISKDCTVGGHFGYVYIDGLCTSMPVVASFNSLKDNYCAQEPVIFNSNATGESGYSVTVQEYPSGASFSQDFLNQPVPATIDIKQFFNSKGQSFICGKKYYVKLDVYGQCSGGASLGRIINIVCPTVNAGLDKIVCCPNLLSLEQMTLGENAQVGYNYNWTSIPNGVTSTNSTIIVNPNALTQSTGYIVTKTDALGCQAIDTVMVRLLPNFTMNINVVNSFCGNSATATLSNISCQESSTFISAFNINYYKDVKWYFVPANSTTETYLGSGQAINTPNQTGKLIARYITSCNNVSQFYNTVYYQYTKTPNLLSPSPFIDADHNVSVQSQANSWRIVETGANAPNIGFGPAYGGAVDFRLMVWDRYGQQITDYTKSRFGIVGDLKNGDIRWDAWFAGSPVTVNSYTYRLFLKYCDSDQWVPTPANWEFGSNPSPVSGQYIHYTLQDGDHFDAQPTFIKF